MGNALTTPQLSGSIGTVGSFLELFFFFGLVSYRLVWGVDLSLVGMIRVHEKTIIMTNDKDIFPFPICRIEYGRRIVYLTWIPMQTTIHGGRFIFYTFFSLDIQERMMQKEYESGMVMISVVQ